MKKLYIIVWQERENEPDWLHVVADNLTETRAKRQVNKYLLEEQDNPDPNFEYFWYTPIEKAEGVGEKNSYSVEINRL